MGKQERDLSSAPEQPIKTNSVVLLLGDIADTTWRMFLPPIIGGLIGWWADTTWHSFPWCSIAGVVLGCIGSAIFIKQLLQKVGNA